MRRRAGIAAVVKATLVTLAVGLVAAASYCFARFSLQQDFAAYWVAGAARRAGLDPYTNQVGIVPGLWDGVALFQHSRFLYPPLAAELFRPLAGLPFPIAKALFTTGAVLAWLLTALLFERRGRAVFLIAGGLFFFPLYLHLERGQIDLYLLPLLVGAWRIRHRPLLAGAALAGAALLKPGLLGVLPVLVALGLWRWLLGLAAGGALLIAATLATSGPALMRRYVAEVLPHAALYGEGGTEAMLLPEARFPAETGGGDPQRVTVGGASYRVSLWQVPASASLPRLLAPTAPSAATSLAPYLVAVATLVAFARRRPHGLRASPSDDRAALLYFAAAVACVVTSPAGWAMGLVWALPLAPLAIGLHVGGGLSARARLGLGAAWIACAIPAPFPGFPAVAGAALMLAAAVTTRAREAL